MTTREKVSEIRLAYAAGIMDGEGSIVIEGSSEIVKKLERRVNRRYQLKLGIVNTSLPLVEMFRETFGGVSKPRTWDKSPLHKKTYTWGLSGRQAEAFLKEITPYLFVKKKQAILALAFMALPVEYEQGENGRWRVSERIMKARKALFLKVREVNDFRGHSQRLIEAASNTDDVIV